MIPACYHYHCSTEGMLLKDFSSNLETNVSELLENIEEMFRY